MGSADHGAIQPSIAIDSADAGQAPLQTAADDESQKLYSFCVTFQDGAKRYFRRRVFGSPETADGADSMVIATPTVEISTKVVKVAAGAVTPTPAPTFTTQPSVSPTSGTAGATTYTATRGTVANGVISSRAWLLNGTSISTTLSATPQSAGTLTYQETAGGGWRFGGLVVDQRHCGTGAHAHANAVSAHVSTGSILRNALLCSKRMTKLINFASDTSGPDAMDTLNDMRDRMLGTTVGMQRAHGMGATFSAGGGSNNINMFLGKETLDAPITGVRIWAFSKEFVNESSGWECLVGPTDQLLNDSTANAFIPQVAGTQYNLIADAASATDKGLPASQYGFRRAQWGGANTDGRPSKSGVLRPGSMAFSAPDAPECGRLRGSAWVDRQRQDGLQERASKRWPALYGMSGEEGGSRWRDQRIFRLHYEWRKSDGRKPTI